MSRYNSIRFYKHSLESPRVSFCIVFTPDEEQFLDILPTYVDLLERNQLTSELVVLIPEGFVPKLRVKKLVSNDCVSIKVAIYSDKTIESRLLNLCHGLAKGNILMSLKPGDSLAPKMTSFIDNQLNSEFERALIFEKKWWFPQRLACLRNTFWEIGGFNESIRKGSQVNHFIGKLKASGVRVMYQDQDQVTSTRASRNLSMPIFKKRKITSQFEQPKEEEYEWVK